MIPFFTLLCLSINKSQPSLPSGFNTIFTAEAKGSRKKSSFLVAMAMALS